MSLTPKQAAFVKAYLIDPNGKKAAIKAGYSKAGAEVAGSRLLRHPKVAEALKKAREPASDQSDSNQAPTFDLSKALQHQDPKNFLLAAMNDVGLDPKQRIDAAKALMPFLAGTEFFPLFDLFQQEIKQADFRVQTPQSNVTLQRRNLPQQCIDMTPL